MNMQWRIAELYDDMSDKRHLWRPGECIMEVKMGCAIRSGENVHEGQENRESVYLRSGYKIYEVQHMVYMEVKMGV